MSAVVLAGGRSSRMGVNKGLLRVGGVTLLERVLERVARVGDEVVIVLGEEDWLSAQPGARAARIVYDAYPGQGALGGLYSGLQATIDCYSVAVACDMPFLNVSLLRFLLDSATGYDVVMPHCGGNLEPLHAVYGRGCLAPMKRLLERGRLRIIDFFGEVRVRYISEAEIARFDPRFVSFFNINTPADLARAEVMARELDE